MEDETLFEFNNMLSMQRLPNTITMSVLLVIGVTSNAVVFSVYMKKLQGSTNRYFIPILAVIDGMAVSSVAIFAIVRNTMRVTMNNAIACRFLYFITWFSTMWSSTLLVPFILNRYLKVCRKQNSFQMTIFVKRLSVILTFGFSLFITFPTAFITGIKTIEIPHTNITGYVCDFERGNGGIQVFLILRMIVYIAILVITVALYALIGRKIRDTFKNKPGMVVCHFNQYEMKNQQISPEQSLDSVEKLESIRQPQQDDNKVNSSNYEEESTSCYTSKKEHSSRESVLQNDSNTERQRLPHRRKQCTDSKRVKTNFNRMFLVVVLCYAVAYIPSCIFGIFSLTQDYDFLFELSTVTLNFELIIERTFIVNHVANPFIFCYFDFSFRKELGKIFDRFSKC